MVVYYVLCTGAIVLCTVYWGCEAGTSDSLRLYCSKIISGKHYKSIVILVVRVTAFLLIITIECDHAIYIKFVYNKKKDSCFQVKMCFFLL